MKETIDEYSNEFDARMFVIMKKKAKTVDWTATHGVEDMTVFGWQYEYKEGLIDATEHYTRYEEDSICFTKGDSLVQINMSTGTVVIQDLHDEYHYGNPTVFLVNEEINAICNIVNIIKNLRDEAKAELCVNK